MSKEQTLRVATAHRIERTLDALAARIAGSVPDELMLLGIRRRGLPLAERLAERLRVRHGRTAPVSEVTVKRYADDLSLLHRHPQLTDAGLPDWHGALVLVDDVLFTGRSLLRVLDWLQAADPRQVLAAVLCARDAREVPVRADFMGMQFDIGPSGVIDVHIPPYENELAVWLSIRPEAE